MARPKIEMSIERDGVDVVAYPFVESDHVSLTNGMNIDTMIRQDVSMPTVTHEDLSFKVGVGDSDVSNSIVDSSVANMTIKGQTYQNILPEPSTHVLSNNKEMFKVNEGLDSNVEIVDGVSKSAILKGQTLVNLFDGHALFSMPNTVISYDEGVYTYQAKEGYEGAIVPSNLMTLKTPYKLELNKKYTFFITQLSGNPCQFGIQSMEVGNRNSTNQSILESQAHNNRIHKFIFTLTSDYSELRLRLNAYQTTEKSIQFKDIMIIEGDYTNVGIPYFEGMQSVKVPVLTTTGKNLLPPVINTWYPCRFKQGTTFKLSTKDSVPSNGGNVVFKDINGTSVWFGIDSGNTTSTKVLPCDVYYIMNSLATGVEHQLEIGTQVTSYEPNKTNILTTPEEVVLKGFGDVQDTLNCNTGEYVERIKEVVYTGDEDWKSSAMATTPDNIAFYIPLENYLDNTNNVTMRNSIKDNLGFTNNCLSATVNVPELNGVKGFSIHTNGNVYFTIPTSECANVESWKTKLREQHLVLQYATTPTVKTVDLSSSGNWEKLVLDGKSSENWQQNSHSGNFVQFEGYSNFCLYSMNLPVSNRGLLCDKLSYYGYDSKFRYTKVEGISDGGGYRLIFVRVKTEKLPTNDVVGFKQWLSQNPIEVTYMLSSHQDSTQVKQPIFFKDGHIIQSSGADNSLIPTLDYQAKTSNSYVMDLMKTNTRYTMKAKSASGTFTIDGTSYGAGTNGTFTSPTSMTNKLLVMNNKTNEEVMILEGDVTDKTIPYFKGIKSAFEDESKIEVLSQGKNFVNKEEFKEYLLKYGTSITSFYKEEGVEYGVINNSSYNLKPFLQGVFKPNTQYTFSARAKIHTESKGFYVCFCYNDGSVIRTRTDSTDFKTIVVTSGAGKTVDYAYLSYGAEGHQVTIDLDSVQITETSSLVEYEPYKLNNTKIPLLSSLKSLPNGVCDEVIINRETKKATLIERSKKVVFNGDENWTLESSYLHDKLIEFRVGLGVQMKSILSDRFYTGGENIERIACTESGGVYIRILKSKVSSANSFKQWLSQNPITIQYELATPIITEVDLEGFPYIYKDGHIFLNGEIAPVTEIKYSINQQHQIEASNQDIIRHQKEIDYLYKLIGEYVRVDYKNTLLSLNLELK